MPSHRSLDITPRESAHPSASGPSSSRLGVSQSSLAIRPRARTPLNPSLTSANVSFIVDEDLVSVVSLEASSSRRLSVVDLPTEIVCKILSYFSHKEISRMRTVSRRFNEFCSTFLNNSFQKLQNKALTRLQAIKAQMPRRQSELAKHPLYNEFKIIENLEIKLNCSLSSFKTHIDKKHTCFFTGEILDEGERLLRIASSTSDSWFHVVREIGDLTKMAGDYFAEKIEPSLPSPYSSSLFSAALTSPSHGNIGERATINYETNDSESRLRTELDEVKQELETCKEKMSEYATRLEDYDRRFKKLEMLGILLTDLNKDNDDDSIGNELI